MSTSQMSVWDRMRRHLQARHPNDTIAIKEEGRLPQCTSCGLYQHNAHTAKHTKSKECKQYTKTKKRQWQEIIQNAANNVRFHIDNHPLEKTTNFKYLGRIIMDKDNDLSAVKQQLNKAQKAWGCIEKLFTKKRIQIQKLWQHFIKRSYRAYYYMEQEVGQ
jgi:predicted RNase H-like nuclease